jgi:subtilisin family serine protease
VINLSMAGHRDDKAVRQAIAYAQARDVLVVAAVGNSQGDDDRSLPSFPAAYPGVLGVGAVDIGGSRVSASQIGSYVDLMAPGAEVAGAARRGGHNYYSGTSFAVPFVVATAALVRAAWPQLTAKQVAERLMATATPARGGSAVPAYGAGVVDPYRAVTEGLVKTRPAKVPGLAHPPVDQQALDRVATWQQRVSRAWFQVGLASTAALVILVLAAVVPAGLRRRWRPTRSGPLPADRPHDEPPDQLFLLPPPSAER